VFLRLDCRKERVRSEELLRTRNKESGNVKWEEEQMMKWRSELGERVAIGGEWRSDGLEGRRSFQRGSEKGRS
jgi:hypothetical protein